MARMIFESMSRKDWERGGRDDPLWAPDRVLLVGKTIFKFDPDAVPEPLAMVLGQRAYGRQMEGMQQEQALALVVIWLAGQNADLQERVASLEAAVRNEPQE